LQGENGRYAFQSSVIAAVIGNKQSRHKFIGYYYRVSAMISEGIHSLVVTGNGRAALFGMNALKKRRMPYTLRIRQALYFWTLVVSVSSSASAAAFHV
jgi:hypothetical protein